MKWFLIPVIALVAVIGLAFVAGMMLPQAHVVSRTARFRAPPQPIWDAITGPPDWHDQKVKVEVVESVAPRRLVTRIADPSLPYGGTWTYEIVPNSAGSVLTITENGEVYNPLFRFVSRFIMGHTATIDAYIKAMRVKLGEA
ncbi:MAG: hypothetical protein ACR2NN_06360 [Bryobacteraceae bacterium]